MGLFDKGKDEVIESLRRMATELRDENARLTRELETYRRDQGGFSKLKDVAGKLTEENKALLDKVENFSDTERHLKQIIEEKNLEISRLQQAIQQKIEEIALKTFAIVSKDSNISISDNLVLTGGIKTSKSITLGDGVTVKGNVEAGETASFGNKNLVYGEVTGSTVRSQNECEFKSSVRGKEAYFGDRNILHAPVIVEDRLEIGSFCDVKEDVCCRDGHLKVGAGTTVERIVSKGIVELGRI